MSTEIDTPKVVDLANYARRREAAALITAAASSAVPEVSLWPAIGASASHGQLSAATLYRADPEGEVSIFLKICTQVLLDLEKVQAIIKLGDNLSADDLFMKTKQLFAELLMYRDISDSVGLVVLRCFQISSKVIAVTDFPELPEALLRALRRTWNAPFLEFGEACDLADNIEIAVSALSVPGYNEAAGALIDDAMVGLQST